MRTASLSHNTTVSHITQYFKETTTTCEKATQAGHRNITGEICYDPSTFLSILLSEERARLTLSIQVLQGLEQLEITELEKLSSSILTSFPVPALIIHFREAPRKELFCSLVTFLLSVNEQSLGSWQLVTMQGREDTSAALL